MPKASGAPEAWVVEELTQDERGPIALGVFRADIQAADPALEEEIRGLPLTEALAWARARTSDIVVRIQEDGDSGVHYAGGNEIEWEPGEMLPPVPEVNLVERRLPGWEFVDRTEADEPIAWEVIVHPLRHAFLAAIEDTTLPESKAFFEKFGRLEPDRGTTITVEARTVAEACDRASELGAAQLGRDPEVWAIVASEGRPVGTPRFARDPRKVH